METLRASGTSAETNRQALVKLLAEREHKGGQRRGALDLVLNEVLYFICADLGVIVHLSIASALSMLAGYANACSRSRV